MRLFLLPISTRRTLIYCERVAPVLPPGTKLPITDRLINKSSEVWTNWEKAEKGWQKRVTEYGNALFRRIPFEEWGLKTLPPATKGKLQEVADGKLGEFECLYPGRFLEGGRVRGVLERLAEERQALHKRKLVSSVAWMPVTIPFAAVPIVPNLPFFYLCFRAYSHYRALFGGRMLAHLMRQKLIATTASPRMDAMYTAGLLHATRQAARAIGAPSEEDIERVSRTVEAQTKSDDEEVMVLQKWNGKLLAEAFELPEMEIEIERAVEQVEESIQSARKLREEKREVEQKGKEGEEEKKDS